MSFIFRYYFLGYMRVDVFKNIFSLYLMKFDLINNCIVNIERLVFCMLFYLEFFDLSKNSGFNLRKLYKVFFGL